MVGSKQFLLGLFVFTFFLLCWNPTPIRANSEAVVEYLKENPSAVADFDYRKENPRAPQHWGDLKEEWSTCKNGKMQSPIAIWEKNATKVVTSLKDLVVNYKPANATIKNEEHAISVLWDGDAGSIQINGTQYFLKQCHWHHPSEHMVDGKKFDLELHMVHKTQDNNKVAVIGFLYKLGEPNSFITKVTKHITSLIDVVMGIPLGEIDPRKVKKAHFLYKEAKPKKAKSKFYRYMGSLTTPPCREGVVWHLNKKVQTVSLAQVKLLQQAVFTFAENNARPIQPLNGRQIKLYGDYH